MSSLTNMLSSFWGSNSSLNIGNDQVLKLGNMLHTMLSEVDTEIDIPTIISVGSQSSGKSSVINGILSMDILPTGTNMVTRSPLRLELMYIPEGARLEFGCYDSKTTNWTISDTISLSVPVPSDNEIKNVRTLIEKKTKILAGHQQNISNKEINIRLYSPHVPNLTIIDLPGIIQVACTDRGQPSNIKNQIIDMVGNYANKKNTIIMAVMPARTDLEADISLEIIKRYDPKGTRTLGVLTKVDLMEEGSDVSQYIMNNISSDLKLNYGYWAVKNRSSSDMKSMNILQGFNAEAKYFSNHSSYKSLLHKNRFGIRKLSNELSNILITKLNLIIPSIIEELKESHNKLKIELTHYGSPVPKELESQIPIVNNLMMKFTRQFVNGISSRGANVNCGRNIKDIFVKCRSDLGDIKPFDEKSHPDKFIEEVLQNFEGNRMSSTIPPIEVFEFCLSDGKTRPHILPVVNECISRVKYSLISLVNSILCQPEFSRFSNLVQFIKQRVVKLMDNCEVITRDQVDNLIRMEEGYIWTDDENFRNQLNASSDNQASSIRTLLREYFKCSIKSIQHVIPKAVMFYFVSRIQKQLTHDLLSSVCGKDDNMCVLLREDSVQYKKRDDCQRRFETVDAILTSLPNVHI